MELKAIGRGAGSIAPGRNPRDVSLTRLAKGSAEGLVAVGQALMVADDIPQRVDSSVPRHLFECPDAGGVPRARRRPASIQLPAARTPRGARTCTHQMCAAPGHKHGPCARRKLRFVAGPVWRAGE